MIQLRDYQELAVEAAYPHDGYGLFLEQRTGKTIVSIELSRRWDCHRIIVICPKKAVPVWRDEILKMGLSLLEFTIVGIESFRINQGKYMKPWDLAIIDESHRIKKRSSQQTKAAWKLGKYARKRLILSGTPQGNCMSDYYAQLHFIRPDLFPGWKVFSDKYLIVEYQDLPGRDDPFPRIVGYKNQEEFKRILASISYRVLREEVAKVKTLVRIKKHKITPSDGHLAHYKALKKKLYTLIEDRIISAPMALVLASKLHQLCGGFVKDDLKVTHHLHSDKLDYLWSLVDGELKGETYAIVANYKAEMDAISLGLTQRGITHVQIRGGKGHQYNPKDRSQVTIMNPSAGEAINLSHHKAMVIYSMNFSFLKWRQFLDRIVLVDTPEVKYHYLIMDELFDENVMRALQFKRRMADEIMDIFSKLSQDDHLQNVLDPAIMNHPETGPEIFLKPLKELQMTTATQEAPAEAVVTTVSLAAICTELGIKPQAARVKLRKKLTAAKGDGFRWAFPPEQVEEIKALLTPAPKAAAADPDEGEGEGEQD